VAGGEDQPQPLVGDRGHDVVDGVLGVPAERAQFGLQGAAPARPAALGPDPVERAVARGGDDPRRRVVRQPVPRPALERDEERVLDGLLGAVEVAEDVGENGDRPARLAPEQAVDEDVLRAGAQAEASAPAAWPSSAA
jgi:hypothetical protein